MDTIEELKNDILGNKETIKIEQERIKKEIERGDWDNADEILNNPNTNNYFNEALIILEKKKLGEDKIEKKKTFWQKLKENFKIVMLK